MMLQQLRSNIYLAEKCRLTKTCNSDWHGVEEWKAGSIHKINTFGTAQKTRKQNSLQEM